MKLFQFNILKSKGLFLLLFVFCNYCKAQNITLDAKALKAKQGEKERLINNINEAFMQPIADSTYLQYETAFWAMMYMEYKPANALPKIKSALLNFTKYDNSFQNALLEVVYSQYPKELEKEVAFLIKDTTITPKQFAVCGEYLINTKKTNLTLVNTLQKKRLGNFTIQEPNYYYYCLSLKNKNYSIQLKKNVLQNILHNEMMTNKNLIISLQNKNRNYPGIVLIRDSIGNVLTKNDSFFYVQQLARSITNLPFYISNGNTPQGVFRINGYGFSKNNHIGPTENFQLCMPNECNVQGFFDNQIIDSVWSNAIEYSFLPQQFQRNTDFSFLYESIFAGKLGRYEIISHGSTVNPLFYNTKPYKGFTPTAGCLQAKEIWDYTTGKRIYSDQQKLIDAYKSIGATKGYLIVLDIIDANRPVNINDFKALLQ
jgi:hypothetical protein